MAGFYAYDPAFLGGVRVAAGDLDGDGVSEILTAAGPGSPHVEAFVLNDARQPEIVLSFYAYHPAFLGGVFVAAGDIDGDGREEVITGADAGGGPHVRVFGTGPAFTALHEVYSFFAYEPGFTGGVRVAAGDLDGDGAAEIITAPDPSHSPLVRVFHTFANGALGERSAFYAYDAAFGGGVFVAAPR
jgi:VCBS repeat protein